MCIACPIFEDITLVIHTVIHTVFHTVIHTVTHTCLGFAETCCVGHVHAFIERGVRVHRGCAAGGVTIRPLKKEQGEDEKVGRWHVFPSVKFFACV